MPHRHHQLPAGRRRRRLASSPDTPQIITNLNGNVVEIDGQSGHPLCNSEGVTINRTFPIILNDRATQFFWNQFCEEVDRALEPMSRIRKILTILSILSGLTTFVYVVIVIRTMTRSFFVGRTVLFWVQLAVPLILIIAMHCCRRRTASRLDDVVKDLKELFTRKSNENPQISFHIADGPGNYVRLGFIYPIVILVKVLDGNRNGDTGVSDMIATFNEISSPGTTPGQTNIAHRLQELEGIKAFITKEEYDHKRQDILNSI